MLYKIYILILLILGRRMLFITKQSRFHVSLYIKIKINKTAKFRFSNSLFSYH